MTNVDGVTVERRFFDMLDVEGQEHVTLMLQRYRTLLPLERNAFLQDLGLVPAHSADASRTGGAASGAVVHYHSARLDEVHTRDPSYVAAAATATAAVAREPQAAASLHASRNDGGDAHTTAAQRSISVLRQLITPEVFGETPVCVTAAATPCRRADGHDGAGAGDADDDADNKDACAPAAAAAPGRARVAHLYRSNAYQALRLAHSFPGHINVRTRAAGMGTDGAQHDGGSSGSHNNDASAMGTLNLTGVPLYEKELRSWFEQLDHDHTGMLSLAQFQACMQALERDFGVTDEYARLAAEGQRLAKDDCLSFEAFAYLIMRFARA